MNGAEKIELLWDSFVHRSSTYALHWHNPTRGGGYARQKNGDEAVPLTRADLYAHLRGEKTVGVYQLNEDSTVKWLCFDIDLKKGLEGTVEEVQQHTIDLVRVLYAHIGASFLVEHSGSRGYHVWLFFSEPIDALWVHAFGNFIKTLTPLKERVGIEVFPKQTSLDESPFGSLVKVPLGIHQKTKERCLFVNNSWEPYPEQWKVLQDVPRVSEAELMSTIERYNIQPPQIEYADNNTSTLVCAKRMMEEGLIPGTRDEGTFRLALVMKDRGLPADMTNAALAAMNDRTGRPMTQADIELKVQSAYKSHYSPFPCGTDVLDPYCSSGCRFWEGKVKNRWTRYGHDPKTAVGRISRD